MVELLLIYGFTSRVILDAGSETGWFQIFKHINKLLKPRIL